MGGKGLAADFDVKVKAAMDRLSLSVTVQRHRDVQKGRASLSIKGQFSGTALQTTDVHAPFQRPLSLGLMLKDMVREPADARACSYRRNGSVFSSTIPTELRRGSPLHRDVPVDI